MDDLSRKFLTETNESPDTLDSHMKPFDKDIVAAKFQEIGLFLSVEPA
jgi:hypothetical protein